ncbi:hypothetical protein BAOM_0200 [Peribacillus asahii]|uniref:Uncharacterized protein n=1 Tax=Peribacillus asahii TaxID=228899 RepID=A0A3T0KKX5_9BACI|nr:hypothetical protein BAOM_0200 [Peribacillus asahii]
MEGSNGSRIVYRRQAGNRQQGRVLIIAFLYNLPDTVLRQIKLF